MVERGNALWHAFVIPIATFVIPALAGIQSVAKTASMREPRQSLNIIRFVVEIRFQSAENGCRVAQIDSGQAR
jgi:hypothetical protein